MVGRWCVDIKDSKSNCIFDIHLTSFSTNCYICFSLFDMFFLTSVLVFQHVLKLELEVELELGEGAEEE